MADISNTFDPRPFAEAAAQEEANYDAPVTNRLKNFALASKTAQDAANNLAAIRAAQDAHDKAQQDLDLEKKQKALDFERMANQNSMTAVQAQILKQQLDDDTAQKQAVLDAHQTLRDTAEHDNAQKLQQSHAIAKNLYQTDPVVQQSVHDILGNLMPLTSAAPTAGQGAAQSLPTIPVGGQILQAPTAPAAPMQPSTVEPAVQDDTSVIPGKTWAEKVQAMRDKGIDPDEIFKGTGMYIPKAMTPEQQAVNLKREEAMELRKQAQQDRLEKIASDGLAKITSARSGGLGLQDSKVNQAIDLRTMVNQMYDPKTKQYVIPPSMHSELVLGLARLLSPTGNVGIEMMNELKQKTAKEGMASALIYMGMDPKKVGGGTQGVIKMFVDTIDRQGETAEKLRDKYVEDIKGRFPKNLDPERKQALIDQQVGSSFKKLLKESPDQTSDGVDTSDPRIQSAIATAKSHGYTDEQIQQYLKGRK